MKSKLKDPRKLLAVFEESGASTFAIDLIHLVVRPTRLGSTFPLPITPNPAALSILNAKTNEERKERVARFEWGGLPVRLVLSTKGNIAATFGPTSVLRRVREDLIRAGAYPSHRRGDEARDENFVDPRLLLRSEDLHTTCIAKAWSMVEEAKRAYAEICREVFGAAPAAVGVSIAQIELTWDRPTSIAKAAPTLWWTAWRDGWPGAVKSHKSAENRETTAVRGAGVLRSDDVIGGGKKLYPKTTSLLRFEAELTRQRMTDLLKRPLALQSPALLRADLVMLAGAPYQQLLHAQRLLSSDRVLDVPDLFEVFASAGRWRKVEPILRAFWSGAEFHNVNERWAKELTRLRKRGAARYIGKGAWGPGVLVARHFHLAQYFARHAGRTIRGVRAMGS